MENIIKAAEACIPRYDITVRPKDKPWFSGDLRRLIRRRNRMFHRWRREPDNLRLCHFYVELRNFTVAKIRSSKIDYELGLFQKLNEINLSNSKSWWHTCKALMSKKPVINSPLSINGELISDNLKKADLFNDYFIKQSSIDESNVRIPYLPRFCNTNIPTKTVESSEVFKILNTLNINKATGPDQIGNRILKESSRVLAEPLSKLFNICIRSGIFPSSWKRAHVIPLHKSGDLTLCNNYRPISLLSSVSKVFETVIFKHINQFLKVHNLLSEKQSGFIPRDSTVNQLTKICHEIFSEFDKGNEICAVFLDFSKAFDKVWHKGLLYKLDRYGVNGSFLKLMASYLGGREQRVIMQNAESTWRLLNDLWQSQDFPDGWREATVIPIPKPGKDRTDPNNYRPIALTSCLCKIMERMINHRLTWFLQDNKIITKYQCGFQKGKSTTDHLVRLETYIRQGFVKNQHTVGVFFDLEKAYDTTWKGGIMKDLHEMGLKGRLPLFIDNFLKGRKFKVRLDNTHSSLNPQEEGVPQGSILSPTLFTVKGYWDDC